MMRVSVAVVLVLAAAAIAGTATLARQRPPLPAFVNCLHEDAPAEAANRPRREAARALAQAVNAEQGRLAEQTRQYQPLASLRGLPPTPDGFELRFYTDGDGYILSLKDTRDPCHFGIFSDQHGRLYEVTPQRPQLAS